MEPRSVRYHPAVALDVDYHRIQFGRLDQVEGVARRIVVLPAP